MVETVMVWMVTVWALMVLMVSEVITDGDTRRLGIVEMAVWDSRFVYLGTVVVAGPRDGSPSIANDSRTLALQTSIVLYHHKSFQTPSSHFFSCLPAYSSVLSETGLYGLYLNPVMVSNC